MSTKDKWKLLAQWFHCPDAEALLQNEDAIDMIIGAVYSEVQALAPEEEALRAMRHFGAYFDEIRKATD